MWKALSTLLAVLLAIALAVCAWLYVGKTRAVNEARTEAEEARAALAGLLVSLNKADLAAARAAVEASRLAQEERDRRYAEIKHAGTEAAVAIATARAQRADEADPDMRMPGSVLQPLCVQYRRAKEGEGIRCENAGARAEPAPVQGKADAGPVPR